MRRATAAVLRRLQAIADRGWSGSAIALYGVMQGTFLPAPSDLCFVSFAAAKPQRAWRFALLATLGSALGATLLFQSAYHGVAGIGEGAFSWFGVSADSVRSLERSLAKWGWLLVLVSMWTPLSTKLLAAVSGASGVVSFVPFIAALALGRFARTGTFAWLLRRYGAAALERWVAMSPRRDADASSADGPVG